MIRYINTSRGLLFPEIYLYPRYLLKKGVYSPFIRKIQTEVISKEEASNVLAQQRLKRPNSPHLSIYRPQLTWYMSGFNRITGCFVSAGLYVFAISYLVSPIFNWHLDSETISSVFHSWPVEAKILTKFIVSFPFTYHSFNGLRHLYWDTGRGLTLKGVYTTGYIVIALSTVSSIILSLI